ncbi:hypothetical protein [Oceanidesulfovibrio indonesiensis]|uniref:hypothetical protein n=1 Tax=Oceanidesulfovibrio indonesiensis TaxID=54767 RepID=UPI0011848C36|nr:hypothetical protein [Oceanidesulfovibrio indonesiensis]
MNWFNLLSTGLGAFLGVLSGLIVNIVTHIHFNRKEQQRQLKNARFELEFNKTKVDEWLGYVERFRGCVVSETPERFYHYFDFTKAPTPTLVNLYQTGKLYEYLDHEDIAKLLKIDSKRNLDYENFFNAKVEEQKNTTDKQEALKAADVWENMFKEDRKMLLEVLNKFPDR